MFSSSPAKKPSSTVWLATAERCYQHHCLFILAVYNSDDKEINIRQAYMYYFSMRFLTGVFTFGLGIFSAAAVSGIFQPAAPERPIGQAVVDNIRTLAKLPRYSASFLEGQSRALDDIKKGRLEFVSTAEKTAREKIFRDILFKEYGIQILDFGWSTDREQIKQNDEFADGYNRTAIFFIEHRFGRDVLGNVKARAAAEAFREEAETNRQILQRHLDFPRSIE